jgi:(2Fe-2S) ferredoxin
MPKPEKHIFVCSVNRGPGHPRGSCGQNGANDVIEAFNNAFQARNLWGKYAFTVTGCLGTCGEGPSVLVYPEGVMYGKVTAADVAAILDEHILGGVPVERLKVAPEIW